MTTGVKKWSSSEGEVKKTSFEPIPAGLYKLKVKRSWEVRKSESEKSSQLRYANGYFEVLGTAKDGGKNRRQYHGFYVDLSPGADGVVMPDRSGQLKEFARAVGEPISPPIVEQLKNNPKDQSKTKVSTLSPKAIVEYMNNLDGKVIEAQIKVTKNLQGNPDNSIDFFVESEEGVSEEVEDEQEESDELDTDDTEGELEDESDESDEDESDEDESDEEEADEPDDDDLPEVAKPANLSKGKSRVEQGPAKKNTGKKAKKK